MNETGLNKLDDFLKDCGEISQEEREDIMEHSNYLLDETRWTKIYQKFDGKYDDLVTAYVDLEEQLKTALPELLETTQELLKAIDYKKAYNILMEYWAYMPEEKTPEINKKLKELGL